MNATSLTGGIDNGDQSKDLQPIAPPHLGWAQHVHGPDDGGLKRRFPSSQFWRRSLGGYESLWHEYDDALVSHQSPPGRVIERINHATYGQHATELPVGLLPLAQDFGEAHDRKIGVANDIPQGIAALGT